MPATGRVRVELRPLRGAAAGVLGLGVAASSLGSTSIECPLRAVTGVPCPFCGMTRGVVDALHGHLAAAAALNPGSVAIVVAAIVLLLSWRRRRASFPAWLPVAVVALLWSFQLFKYATNRPL